MIMKWGGAFIVVILVMGACGAGVKDVREAVANRAPIDVACPEFVARPPAGTWVRLTGAAGALRDAAYREKNGVADRLYVPLTCGGPGPIHVVMATEDERLLADLRASRDADVRRDIVGMVRNPKDHEAGTTTGGGLEGGCANCTVKLQGLAPGYVIIEDGNDPSMVRGLAWLAGAIAGCVALVRIVRSGRS
jgi:hypothetical protein